MDRQVPRRVLLATAAAGAALPGGGAARTGTVGNRQGDAPATAQAHNDLWERWSELWNGDLAVADEIVAPGFVAHFAPVGTSPGEVRGPEGLKGWIGGSLAAFADYRFETSVGPLADGAMLAGRWVFRGTYRGGIPGSSPDALGKAVEYAGIDLLRVEAGQLVEYWLSADTLILLQQIGVIPS